MRLLRLNLILIGLVVGAALGLVYGLLIEPVRFVDTVPAMLAAEYKRDMVVMIAEAYSRDGDLTRADGRLRLLGFTDTGEAVIAAAQREAAAAQPDVAAIDALNALALAYMQGAGGTAVVALPTESATPTQAPTATPSVSPEPTFTLPPAPAATTPPPPTAAPAYDYALIGREPVCDSTLGTPLIQVIVNDALGTGIAGVQVSVQWPTGGEQFFTGLKPELGPGYADFEMTPNERYSVQVGEVALPVTDVEPGTCTDEAGDPYPGTVRLVFARAN